MKNIKMSKNNKILLGLLAVLLTMSVGYAIFSDSIKVTGTAVARSDWGFEITCAKGVNSKIASALELSADEIPEFGYENDTCSVSGKSVTTSVDLKMPTALRYFTVNVKNTGGVDAVIRADEVIPPSSYKLQLYNKSDNSLYKEYDEATTSGFWDIADNYSTSLIEVVAIEDENGNMYVTAEQDDILLQKNMLYEDADGAVYLKIAPNQTLHFLLVNLWEEDAVSTNYFGKTIVTYDFDVKQFTTDLKVSTTGSTCMVGC